jgi:pentatricopeptide repeat protein
MRVQGPKRAAEHYSYLNRYEQMLQMLVLVTVAILSRNYVMQATSAPMQSQWLAINYVRLQMLRRAYCLLEHIHVKCTCEVLLNVTPLYVSYLYYYWLLLCSDQMTVTNVPIDVVAYTATMDACAAKGKWRESLAILDEMRAKGIAPNDRTFRAAIAA